MMTIKTIRKVYINEKNNNVTSKLLSTTSYQNAKALALCITIMGISYSSAVNAHKEIPTGGNAVAGTASITSPSIGNVNTNQSSDRAIIEWNSFNIGNDAKAEFFQPNSNSLTVN